MEGRRVFFVAHLIPLRFTPSWGWELKIGWPDSWSQSFSVSSCADGISKNLRFLHFEITLSGDPTYLVFVEEYIYIEYPVISGSYWVMRMIANQDVILRVLIEHCWSMLTWVELPEVVRCSICIKHLSRPSQLPSSKVHLHPKYGFQKPFLKRNGGSFLHIILPI